MVIVSRLFVDEPLRVRLKRLPSLKLDAEDVLEAKVDAVELRGSRWARHASSGALVFGVISGELVIGLINAGVERALSCTNISLSSPRSSREAMISPSVAPWENPTIASTFVRSCC